MENSQQRKTYYYETWELMQDFGDNKFDARRTFYPQNDTYEEVVKAKQRALEYYQTRLNGVAIGEVTFTKPFASFDEFVRGQHAAYSIELFFVFDDGDNPPEEYSILGGEESEMEDGIEAEKEILAKLRMRGFSLS